MRMQFFLIAALVALGLAACQSPSGTAEGDNKPADSTAAAVIPPAGTADAAHNAANSLDIAGMYTGTLPCASCEGIRTELKLADDKTFVLKEAYQGAKEPLQSEMKGNWVVEGNFLTLQFSPDVQDRILRYKVEENRLRQLDMNDEVIEGALADKYILKKQ